MHWVLLGPTQRHYYLTNNSFELQVGPQGPTLLSLFLLLPLHKFFIGLFFGKLKGSGLFANVIVMVSGPWFTPVAGSLLNLVLHAQLRNVKWYIYHCILT